MCCGFWLLIVWLMFGFVIVVACWLAVVGGVANYRRFGGWLGCCMCCVLFVWVSVLIVCLVWVDVMLVCLMLVFA